MLGSDSRSVSRSRVPAKPSNSAAGSGPGVAACSAFRRVSAWRAGRVVAPPRKRLLGSIAALLILAVGFGRVWAQEVEPSDCERVLPPDLRRICERGELRIVRFGGERPPFFHQDGDDWVGFDVDLGRDMARRLGVRYREVDAAGSFDEVVDRVADGSADLGLSKLSATLARAQRVRFSRAYLTVYQALLVNRLSDPGGGDPFQALNAPGFEIGALGGTAYVGYAAGTLRRAEVHPYDDFEAMMNDVVSGAIDAALMDSARSDNWRRAHQQELIHVRTTIDRSRSDPLAVAVAWENTHLLAWVNLYLERIRADGTAERFYQKWFSAGSGAAAREAE